MSLRTIIYRRVSSDEQKKNNSPSAQQTDGIAYAERYGMTVIDSLLEDFTGTTIDRPVFNRLLELADAGVIDAVIVQHPDRLGRGPILELAIALLAKRGVEVHACNRGLISDEDDETSQIQNSVDGLVSGIERRNIRRRLTRGIVEKVTVSGKMPGYGGAAAYGYKWEGFRRDRTLVINEEEAKYVRLLFEWYISGVTVTAICERLEAMRILTPAEFVTRTMQTENRCRWITPTIYRMLKNTIYIGTFQAFERTKPNVKKRLHTEPVAVQVPAIISQETFERAQQQLAVGRKNSQRNTQRFYLLRCRARCACGASIIGVFDQRYRYYRCAGSIRKRDRITPCHVQKPNYNATNVEYTAWHWIEENVLHEENLREGIAAKNALASNDRAVLEDQLDHYNERISAVEREMERLKQLYTSGLYSFEEIAKDKRQLDESRARLEAERDTVEQKLAGVGISDEAAQELLEMVRAIKEKAHNLTDESKRKIIELCGTTAILYRKDDQPWIHIEVALTLQQEDTAIVSHVLYNAQHKQNTVIKSHVG
jgi:site-specific DNA recombinase